jgi:hypothetical protein
MALQTLCAGSSVPDDVWAKIEEFQKKGGAACFNEAMNTSLTLVEVNNQIIQAMESDLAAEEQDDAKVKA